MQFDDLHVYLKCHYSTGGFKHFASKNQLHGLSVSGTLIENGLNELINFYSPQNHQKTVGFFRIRFQKD